MSFVNKGMNILRAIEKNFEIYIASALLGLMVAFTFLQIVGRYILTTPFPWTEELTRYMFIWLVYITISYGVKENRHIQIGLVKSRLSGASAALLDIFSTLVFLFLTIIFTILGYELFIKVGRSGQTASTVITLPMWTVYLVAPLGFSLTCFRLIQNFIIQTKAVVRLLKADRRR